MTIAICLNCGARKFGAFVRCLSCGYEPTEEEDKAKSILLSDHYLSAADLGDVSERIKSGRGVNFDPASVQKLIESARVVDKDRPFGTRALAWFTCGVVLVLGVLLGLVVVAIDSLIGK